MSAADITSRKPDCPSDFALDMLRAEELSAVDAATLNAHVISCDDCAARLAEFKAGFDAEPGVDPRRILAGARRLAAEREEAARPWWQKIQIWLPAAAVGAAAVVFAVMPGVTTVDTPGAAPGPAPSVRTKGGLGLRVFRAESGDLSVEQISGAHFTAGDRLRFKVSLPEDGVVALIGVEASGAQYPVWPLAPGVDGRMGKTTEEDGPEGRLLPGAFRLDAALGREAIHLVLCLAESGPPRCEVEGDALRCAEGCRSTAFIVEKGR